MSSPTKKVTIIVSAEVTVPHQQQANKDTQPIGSTITRNTLRVRKPTKKKNKKIVPRRVFFGDSDEGSEERVPDREDFAAVRGCHSDMDKLM